MGRACEEALEWEGGCGGGWGDWEMGREPEVRNLRALSDGIGIVDALEM